MEDLPIGSEIVLKVVETEKEECNGCFFDELCGDIYNVICKNFLSVAQPIEKTERMFNSRE